MLKLLTITLTRSSSLLVDGDGGASLLPEVLERLLPLLTQPQLAELHREVADIICRILSLLDGTAPGLAAALARGTVTLFEGACGGQRGAVLHALFSWLPVTVPAGSQGCCAQHATLQAPLPPTQPTTAPPQMCLRWPACSAASRS